MARQRLHRGDHRQEAHDPRRYTSKEHIMELLVIGIGVIAAWAIGATVRAVSRDGYGQIPTDFTCR